MENKNNNEERKNDKYIIMAGFALDCFEAINKEEYAEKEELITENVDYIIKDIAFVIEEKVTEVILGEDEKEKGAVGAITNIFKDNNLPFISIGIEQKEKKVLDVLSKASYALLLLVGNNNIKTIIDDHIKLSNIENSKEGFSKYK